MSKETKFTEKELTKIKEIQNSYLGVQQAFGQLEVNKLRLNQQLDASLDASDELRSKFTEIQTDEQKLIEDLNEKYGDGTLDIESGTFTPNKSE